MILWCFGIVFCWLCWGLQLCCPLFDSHGCCCYAFVACIVVYRLCLPAFVACIMVYWLWFSFNCIFPIAFVACILVYWLFVFLAFSTSCAWLLMIFAVSKKKNLVLFNSIVLNVFYILITYNMNSWEWMTTDPSFQLRPNWIVQINRVSIGMDSRLFVILGDDMLSLRIF